MLLITVDEVIASMGLAASLKYDLSDTITSTIAKAQARLSYELGTSIERYVCEDKVMLNSDLYSGVSVNGMLKVKLTNMFVDQASVSVKTYPKLGETGTKTKPLIVNSTQGEVFFPLELDNQFLDIKYTSGFQSSDVPDDIKQSLLLYTSMIFSANQPNTSDSAKPSDTSDLAASVVANYKKVSAFAFRPFYHTQERE